MPGLRYFFSDPGRFPGYGGHAVPANTQTSVELLGATAQGPLRKSLGEPYAIAGGAVIDLEFTMSHWTAALSHRSPARTSLVGKCCVLLSR